MFLFQINKEVAEKLVKRAMSPLREILEANADTEVDVNSSVSLTYAQIKSLDTDLGTLGMALAQQFKKNDELTQAVAVVAEENERLHSTVDTLVEHLTNEKNYVELLQGKYKELIEKNADSSSVSEVSAST